MNKKLLIGIGIFLAAVVVGMFLIPKKTAEMPVPGGSGVPEATVSNVREFIVKGTDYAFSPSVVTVKKGDSVRIVFENEGNSLHSLAISDLNIATKTIGPGRSDSIEFTAETAGNFAFTCTVSGHKDRGMIGTLIVE